MKKKKFRLRIKHLLFISLVINLFLVGIMAGHAIKPPFPGKFRHGHMQWRMNPDALTKNLPADKAEMIEEKFDELREENKSVFKKMRKARKDIISTLTADDFDKDDYQEKVDELNEIRNEMIENFSDTIIDIASELSPEERKTLAENMKEMEKR